MSKEIAIDIKDARVLKSLFDDFYVPLCLFIGRYLPRTADAEDIAQECFIQLWQQRGEFRFLNQVKAFLYKTARNRALNELEHRRVEDIYIHGELEQNSEAFFHDHVIEEETYRMLRNAIDRLPEQTRQVMMLALEEHSNKEIAAMLQIAEGTVHSLKKIAYRRLREDLKDYFYLCMPLLVSMMGR